MKRTLQPYLLAALAAALCINLPISTQAQFNETWDGGGGDDNWTTGNNWADNTAPGSPQGILNFAGTTRLTPNNNFGSYSGGYRIFFNSGAGAFTLNGNPIKFFDFGGNRAVIQNDSASTQTINLRVGAGNSTGGLDFGPNTGDIIYNGGSIDNGTIFLDGSSQLRVFGNSGRTLTLNKGIINGDATGTVAINGPSTTIYNTTGFTYSGDTFVNNGTLRVAVSGAAPNTTFRLGDTSGSAGANLNLDGGASITNIVNVRAGSSGTKIIANTASTSGAATYAGNLFLDGSATLFANSGGSVTLSGGTLDLKNQTLTVDGSGSTLISGVLQQTTGSGKLTKSGAGTLTLSGVNTYVGATTVNNGTLAVNGSLASGSAVSVASGATVGGAGAINGSLTVNSGGTLAPGNSGIGILTNAASPSLGGICLMEINRSATTNADKLVCASGGLTYGGTLVVTNIGAAAQNGDTFTLFNASSYSGTFSSLTLPAGGTTHWKTNKLVVDGSVTFSNRNPVAVNLTLGVAAGGSNTLQVMGGKHTPTDADGDTVTVSAVTQGANGSVNFTGSTVTYTSTNSAASDSFTYTVSDGIGGTDVKTVTVAITNPEGFNRLSPPSVIGAGTVALSFLGVPGYNYALDWATNLTPPINWMGVTTNTAAANGSLHFTNTSAAAENYFRTRYVGP